MIATAGARREPPLFVRVVPPVLRRSASMLRSAHAAVRAGTTLPRAGLLTLEGLGRVHLDVRGSAPGESRRLRSRALRDVLAELCRVHRIEIDVEGTLPDGPAVLVANHRSYLDPLVIAALSACAPIAKQEVAGWPVVGAGARALGVLFVRRDDPWSGARVLRDALRSLEDGVPVLCFPEGTTTTAQHPLPFHRGVFGVARLAGVPIVPIALGYADPAACWVGDDDFLPPVSYTHLTLPTKA